MTPEDRGRIVEQWLSKSDEALADATTLYAEQSVTGTANRCYYAMFYAASALAVHDSQTLHKHRAVISYLHREYVKTGRLSQESGRALLTAFDRRTQADYHAMLHFGRDEVTQLLDSARRFVTEIRTLLETSA